MCTCTHTHTLTIKTLSDDHDVDDAPVVYLYGNIHTPSVISEDTHSTLTHQTMTTVMN